MKRLRRFGLFIRYPNQYVLQRDLEDIRRQQKKADTKGTEAEYEKLLMRQGMFHRDMRMYKLYQERLRSSM